MTNSSTIIRTLPDVGLRWALSGSRMPPVVFSSVVATLASTRSPLGLSCGVVGWEWEIRRPSMHQSNMFG